MPVRFRINVAAPPDKVFAEISDVASHGTWANPNAKLDVQAVTPGPTTMGSEFRSTQRFVGKDTSAVIKVIEYVPPTSFAITAAQGVGKRTITYSHTFTLTPSGDGTIVERAIDSDAPLPQKVLGLFAYPAIRADAMKGLRGLKAKVEGAR